MKRAYPIPPRFDGTPTQGDPPSGDPPAGDPPHSGDPQADKGGTQGTPKDELHEIIVNGEKRSVTLEEMRELAQTSAGAQQKFQEAADMRKEAEKGVRVMQVLEELNDPNKTLDPSVLREYAGLLGLEADQMDDFINKMTEDDEGEGTPTPGQLTPDQAAKLSKKDFEEYVKATFGMDPEDIKGTIAMSRQRDINDAKKEIQSQVEKAVDRDELLGKMAGKGDKKDDRLEIFREEVLEGVLKRIYDGVPLGADMLQAEIQKVRSKWQRFGIPSTSAMYPGLGQVPGVDLPTEVHNEEPIKRITADKDASGDNFTARWIQRYLQARRNAGNA